MDLPEPVRRVFVLVAAFVIPEKRFLEKQVGAARTLMRCLSNPCQFMYFSN
jgi:hypothetical protein